MTNHHYGCRIELETTTTVVKRGVKLKIKLSDAELQVMQILWSKGAMRAAAVAEIAHEEIGWETNTTYTLINRLVKKGAVKRVDPGYICETILTESEVCIDETKRFLNKMYNGSLNLLVKSFLSDQSISENELEELRKLINEKR